MNPDLCILTGDEVNCPLCEIERQHKALMQRAIERERAGDELSMDEMQALSALSEELVSKGEKILSGSY